MGFEMMIKKAKLFILTLLIMLNGTAFIAAKANASINSHESIVVVQNGQALSQKNSQIDAGIKSISLPSNTPQVDTQTSLSLINRITMLINVIKNEIHTIFNVSIAPNIIVIINAIELQCKNLIILATNSSNPADSNKLNEIHKNLDDQRRSLSLLIGAQSGSDPDKELRPYLSKIYGSEMETKENTLPIFSDK